MDLLLIGLNHKTTPLELREKFFLSEGKLNQVLPQIKTHAKSLKGIVILCTCNRVEYYGVSKQPKEGLKEMLEVLTQHHKLKIHPLKEKIYQKSSLNAIEHLYKVACGMDSMILGENEILGQVKKAYFKALEKKTTESILNKVFQTAIQVGKQVRAQTGINKGNVSIGSICVELVKKIHSLNTKNNILIIGAGKVGKNVISHLKKRTKAHLMITNRSKKKAKDLAKKVSGSWIPYEEKHQYLIKSDVTIVSTSSKSPIIKKDVLNPLIKTYGVKTTLIIDLSVPRNVDPTINDFDHFILYSIDDLKIIIDSHKKNRHHHFAQASEIILEHLNDYSKWYWKQKSLRNLENNPQDLQLIKQKTLSFFSKKMHFLAQENQKLIEDILNQFIKNLNQKSLPKKNKP